MKYTTEQKKRARLLYNRGWKKAEISRQMAIPESTIHGWVTDGVKVEIYKGGKYCHDCLQQLYHEEKERMRECAKKEGRPLRCGACYERTVIYETFMGAFERRVLA